MYAAAAARAIAWNSLAKLSRPKLFDALRRERLFDHDLGAQEIAPDHRQRVEAHFGARSLAVG